MIPGEETGWNACHTTGRNACATEEAFLHHQETGKNACPTMTGMPVPNMPTARKKEARPIVGRASSVCFLLW